MARLALLALREIGGQRRRSLLSIVAIAMGVALVVASGSVAKRMQAGLATPAPLLGRPADLWITSAFDVDYDLPAGLAARVAAVPGVTRVEPVVRRPVRVEMPPEPIRGEIRSDALSLVGVNPASYLASHDLTLAAGRLPSDEAPGLVALAPWALIRDIGLNHPVTVTTPAGSVLLPVTGLIEVKSLAAVQQGIALYAPLGTMADLFGLSGAATLLEAQLAPNARLSRTRRRLEEALGPAYAVASASQARGETQLWQRLVLGALTAVSGLTLMGSATLIYIVFTSATQSRRHQIGLLRAAGATRLQALALLLTEAAMLGLAGSGLGLALGWLFGGAAAKWVMGGTPAMLEGPPFPASSSVLAVILGLSASVAGAFLPTLRAARQMPIVALGVFPGRQLVELHATHTSPAEPANSPQTRPERWGLWNKMAVHQIPTRRSLGAGLLARVGGRTALVVGALALILAMALGNVGILSLLGEELATTFGQLATGDFIVLPGLTTLSLRELAGQDTSDVPPLSPGLLVALEDLAAQGDRLRIMRGTTADIKELQVFPGQPTLLLDIDGYAQMGGFRFEAGDWPSALAAFRQGPAVLLSPIVARRLHVGLGDTVELNTVQGRTGFRVAGIGDSEFTTCVLDLADGEIQLGANEVNAVEIQIASSADRETVRRVLLDIVQSHGGTLLSLEEVATQLEKISRQARLSIGLLVGVTGVVAILGVFQAALATVAEQRREIGLLRAVGATAAQIRRMVLAEMAIQGVVAALLGTALGWGITLLFLALARRALGMATTAGFSSSAWLMLGLASLASLVLWPLLAMAGGAGPALYASRLPVIRSLQTLD